MNGKKGKICRFAALAVFALSANPLFGLTAEDAVLRLVERLGYSVGYDGENERSVAVATVKRRESSETHSLRYSSEKVDRHVLVAEFKARAQIMGTIEAEFSGKRELDLEVFGAEKAKDVKSAFGYVARNPLLGCETIACSTASDHGVREVSVAVVWNEKLQASMIRTFSGPPPTEDGVVDWAAFAATLDPSAMPASRKLVDSKGYAWIVGIGAVDVEGLERNSLRMRSAYARAREKARANVAFALHADVEVSEKLLRGISQINENGESEACSFEQLSFEMTRATNARTSSAPEQHLFFARDAGTGRLMAVSLCAYPPSQLPELGILESSPARILDEIETEPVAVPEKRVKIWNPRTMRFE